MCTNCSSEQSFSKIKLKSRLRASMTNDRLSNLALLSTESDLLCEIEFDDILDDFAAQKLEKSTFD